ncbi:MAG TPA: YHYH protein [Bryobacteraceae bacterium]|jgi:uncharacterized protein (TIGR03437 family)
MRLQSVLFGVFAASAFAQPPGGPPPGGASGDGIWRRNAYYGELITFDACVGHQPGNGMYHYHANPLCLRGQLNDNVVAARTSRNGVTYSELQSGWHHSPILGWALDGYPVYGPYGYSNPMDTSSPIKRIRSGFQLRKITQRISLPAWSLPNHAGISQNLNASQYGPDVSITFPLGRYVEDYDWASSAGDLDQYNGRFTVTPEFPNGTYAYYVTIDDTGTPAFPFIIAGQYYGTAGSGFSPSANVSAADYFSGGTYSSGPATPLLTSWSTTYSTNDAKVVSGYDPSAGPQTTWSGQSTPALAETQRIRYSDSTVYVTSNGLAGYPMGPWFSADMPSGVFVNFPKSNNTTLQLPRAPAAAATHASTGMGPQGMWVNGVLMFNFLDGASYINATGTDSMAGNTPALDALITSAASFEQGPQAPGSLVSAFPLFFSVLSTSTGGTSVSVRDSSGNSMPAQLSYASPGQLNFLLPAGLASGAGIVTITAGGNTITSHINIQPVYPNLFMANPTALAAGSLTRVHNGASTVSAIGQEAIALNGDDVYLTLYGSGLGLATTATATIGGVAADVSYAGPQGSYAGLDQYNILIPASAAGMGKVDVVVTADGKASNPVNVVIQ